VTGRPPPRNLSLEERSAAAERVRELYLESKRILAGGGVAARVIDGSALAAEVEFGEDGSRRAIVRMSLFVPPGSVTVAERTLRTAGFGDAIRTDDLLVIRLALERGRRVVHTLFDDELPPRAGTGSLADLPAPRHHPASEEGRRERARRLSLWKLDTAVRLMRIRHWTEPDGLASSESLEISLVVEPPAAAGGA
jgi:hypothetical protein